MQVTVADSVGGASSVTAAMPTLRSAAARGPLLLATAAVTPLAAAPALVGVSPPTVTKALVTAPVDWDSWRAARRRPPAAWADEPTAT